MLHMSGSAALLLLIFGVATVLADSKIHSPFGFGDWLAKSTALRAGPSSVAIAPAYEYGEVEVHNTCLQEFKRTNCGRVPGEVSFYEESEFTCCGGESHAKELALEPTKIGHCDFTVPEGAVKAGKFFALCHFEKKADECGEPFCDKMVLSVQGDYYEVFAAIVSSTPDRPSVSTQPCHNRRRVGDLKQQLTEKSTDAAKVVAKASYDPYYDHPHEGVGYSHSQTLYKVPLAVVFYGPFTVNSRAHSVKYDQGWFEFVSDYDDSTGATPITKEQAGDAYVLDPYKYKLSFIKNKSY